MRKNHPIAHLLLVGSTAATLACLACASAFPSLDNRSSDEKKDDAYRRCDADDTKTWDLGTGRLPEIKSKAPKFYDFMSGSDAYGNERRIYLLSRIRQLPEGVGIRRRSEAEPTSYLGKAFEFVGPETEPSKLVGFRVSKDGEQTGMVLLTSAECPHVIVQDKCEDGHLTTEVHTKDPLACAFDRNGQFQLRFGVHQDAPTLKVEPGVPVFVDYEQLGVSVTLSVDGTDVFQGPVTRENDGLAEATPAAVLAMIQVGDDAMAGKAYNRMNEKWRTPDFATQVKDLRVKTITASLADAASPQDVLQKVNRIAKGPNWPGTDEVMAAIRPKLVTAFNDCAKGDATPQLFKYGLIFLKGLDPNSEGLDLNAFRKKYGQALVDEKLGSSQEDLEDLFMGQFPQSTFTAQLNDKRARAAAEAAKIAAQEAEAARREAAQEAVAEKKQCLAQCRMGCTGFRVEDKALCNKGCELRCSGDECAASCAIGCSSFKIDNHSGCYQSCKAGRCE